MVFIEAPAFTRYVGEYLSDGEYAELQAYLADYPDTGNVMPGTGGFRKMRWSDSKRGKGKSGGLRIIYFFFEEDEQIWLLTLYDKGEMSDLTENQKQALRNEIETEKRARRLGRKQGGH